MGAWRKVITNTTGDTGSGTTLGHITPQDLALKAGSDGTKNHGADKDALHIDSNGGLEWKPVVTSFADLEDTDTETTTVGDNDIMVYDAADSKYRMMPMAGDVLLDITGTGASKVATMAIQPNSVTLSTDTTGNYIATGSCTGTGITGSSTGEGSTFTVSSNATNIGTTPGTIISRGSNGDFEAGTMTGNLTGTASLATEITVTANNSTDETAYPLFADGATGNQGAETDSGFTYNPSSGVLTATGFSGSIDGVIGGNVAATGTFTDLTSSGTTNLSATNVVGALHHSGGSATFGNGTMVIDNFIDSGAIVGMIASFTQDDTDNDFTNLLTTNYTIVEGDIYDIELINQGSESYDWTYDDFYWFRLQDVNGDGDPIQNSYSYGKFQYKGTSIGGTLANNSSGDVYTHTVSSTAYQFRFEAIDIPDDVKLTISMGTGSPISTVDPETTAFNITIHDNVTFSGGGTFTSSANFATTDNLIHLNTSADNSDYGADTDTGIVFGRNVTSGNEVKGGKILNKEAYFSFTSLYDTGADPTPTNQDILTLGSYKSIRTKGMIFDTTDCIDPATDFSYAATHTTPMISVDTNGVLYVFASS